MLGTFAVSWFGFAFLCWLALRQATILDSEVVPALMEIVYWSAVTVFLLPPHYCARILLLARRMCAVPPCLHAVLGQNLVPGYGVEGRTMVGHIPPPCLPVP